MHYLAIVSILTGAAACAQAVPVDLDADLPDARWTGTDAPTSEADAPTSEADAAQQQLDASGARPDASRPDASRPDASAVDASAAAADAAPTVADAGTATDAPAASGYRHTILIDGVNDFTVATEQFSTTSASYQAYIAWDDEFLYLGYSGADIDNPNAGKWWLVYFDTDPGGPLGTATGESYNTQAPSFPSGFLADCYYRWRTTNDHQELRRYTGTQWEVVASSVPATFKSGTFVETAIPLVDLGAPQQLGITALMIDEQHELEWSYAGLYADSFIDGYYPAIPVTHYLRAEFGTDGAPNDDAYRAP